MLKQSKVIKTILILVIVLAPFFLSIQSVEAQTSKKPSQNNLCSFQTKEVTGAIDGCEAVLLRGMCGGVVNSVQQILSGIYSDAYCIGADGNPTSLDYTKVQTYYNSNPGVLGFVNNVNAELLNQAPASGIGYLEQKVYALTNPGKVSAQAADPLSYYPGFGSTLLSPIQGFWGWSVNFVYGFLILLIVAIAFAIMFRQRLGGSEIVTIQNAIPNIALAMILVPLSYAISGLFIDGVTVGTNAVHDFLLGPGAPGRSVYDEREPWKDPATGNTATDRGYYADDVRVDVFRARERIDLRGQFSVLGQSIAEGTGLNGNIFFKIIGGIINLVTPNDEQNNPGEYAWIGDIINAIISILTIWIALKIFKRLFMKFLVFLLAPPMSPFIFATAAIPGNGMKSIMMYLRTLGSASLFYIVAYAMFLLTIIFTDPGFHSSIPDYRTNGYIPPLLGIQQIIGFLAGGGNTNLTSFVLTLVGLGIYFYTPTALDNIDTALGTKSIMPEFIKAPIQNFRESINVTGRAAQIGFRRGAEALNIPRVARPTAQKLIQNTWDQRIRGLKPGEVGTWQATQSKELATRKAAAQQRRQAGILSGDNTAVRAANRELENIEREAKIRDIPIGYADKENVPDLKVTFQAKNGSPANMINVDTTFVSNMIKTGKGVIAGDLNIESSNFTLPNPATIIVGSTKPLTSTELDYDRDLLTISANGVEILGGADPAISAYVRFVTDGITATSFVPSSDGKKIVIPMKIFFTFTPGVLPNPIFGEVNTNTGLFEGGWLGANGIIKFENYGGVKISPSKKMLKIAQYESNPVDPFIQYVK